MEKKISLYGIYNHKHKYVFFAATTNIDKYIQRVLEISTNTNVSLRLLLIKYSGWTTELLVSYGDNRHHTDRAIFTDKHEYVNKYKSMGYNVLNVRSLVTTQEYKNQMRKQWRINNRERELKRRIKVQKRTICYCECGSTHTRRCRWEHRKTKLHRQWVDNPHSFIQDDVFTFDIPDRSHCSI